MKNKKRPKTILLTCILLLFSVVYSQKTDNKKNVKRPSLPIYIVLGDTAYFHEKEFDRSSSFEKASFTIWNDIFEKLKRNSQDSLKKDYEFIEQIYKKNGGKIIFRKIRSFGKGYYPVDALKIYFMEKAKKNELLFLTPIFAG